MSKDLLVSRLEPDDEDAAARQRRRRRGGLVLGGVTVLALAGAAAVLAGGGTPLPSPPDRPSPASDSTAPDSTAPDSTAPDFPLGEGLVGSLRASSRGPAASLDVDRLHAEIVISDAMPRPREVLGVVVDGLGTTYVDVPPTDVRIAPGGSVTLPATVIPDCRLLARHGLRVLVDQKYAGQAEEVEQMSFAAGATPPEQLLAGLCPPTGPGLHVVATTARVEGGGVAVVRLVDTGDVAARIGLAQSTGDLQVSSDPPLPVGLDPGESTVLRVQIGISNCSAATGGGQLALRATASTGQGAPVTDRPASRAAGPSVTGALAAAAAAARQAVRASCRS